MRIIELIERCCVLGLAFCMGGSFLTRQAWVVLGSLMVLAFCGCDREKPKVEPPATPTVSVSRPLVREVVEYEYFTGRTAAPFTVEIRPRVTGYLKEMPFKEGEEIKKGDLLFRLDEEPYASQLKKAQSDLELNKARLKLAQADNERAKGIAKANAGAISKQDLDRKGIDRQRQRVSGQFGLYES